MQVKLSQILSSLESGGRPKGGASLDNNGIPSLGAEHLDGNGGFNFKTIKYIPEGFFNALKNGIVEKENILIVKDGATTGKVSFVTDEFPFDKAAVNEHVFLLKVDKSKANPKFAFHYLKGPQGQRDIMRDFRGATVGGISRGFVDFVKFELPPLPAQLHIANILSKAENLIAQRKESIRLLDEFLKSTFLEMFGDPKNNKKGFEIKNLSEFYINPKEGTKCGPFGSALKKDEYTESGIPVWTMDNILKSGEFNETGCLFVSEEKHKELERYNAINGDIIISRAGTVGKMCIIKTNAAKSVISSNLIRLRLGKNLMPIYFYSLMRYCQSRVIKLKHGNEDAYTHMSTGVLDEIYFPYPPIELQTQFAQIVEKIEALKIQYQQSLQELENLYGSLSQKAFRGELSVKQ